MKSICVAAAERHNLGDMLMPFMAMRLRQDPSMIVAATRSSDMRPLGGHLVVDYRRARDAVAGDAYGLIYAGGESLGIGMLDALLMSQDAADRELLDGIRQRDSLLAQALARSITGSASPLAYVLDRADDFEAARVEFHAVGLSNPVYPSPAMERMALKALDGAEHVGVRDEVALAWAGRHGIAAVLEPCAVSAIRDLCDDDVERSADEIPVGAAQPDGDYLMLQISAQAFAAASAADLVDQVRKIVDESGVRVVLFAAGTAPGHDDLAELRFLAGRTGAQVVESKNIWQCCRLIKHSRGFVGTSLHGRIIAQSYGVPRRSIVWGGVGGATRKVEQYCDLWDPLRRSMVRTVDSLARAVAVMLDDPMSSGSGAAPVPVESIRQAWALGPPTGAAPEIDRRSLLISVTTQLLTAAATSTRHTSGLRRLANTATSMASDEIVDDPVAEPADDLEFDAARYHRENPDLAIDPSESLAHYRRQGWRESRDPHPCFDVGFYRTNNPDLGRDSEPFEHYKLHGWREGRDPNRWFDVAWYLANYPDVLEAGREPLGHYLELGWQEGRDPSAAFDGSWYADAYGAESSGRSPLEDHILVGQHVGRGTAPVLPTTVIDAQPIDPPPATWPAVVVHLHYGELWDELIAPYRDAIDSIPLYVTVTPNVLPGELASIRRAAPDARIVDVPNRGRDIAPLVRMLPILIGDGVDVAVKLHSKRSPEVGFGDRWRSDLLHSLAPSLGCVASLHQRFLDDERLGMAIPDAATQPLSLHLKRNEEHLVRLAATVAPGLDIGEAIREPAPFPRGSMFWFRPAALEALTTVEQDRFEPEEGQTDGTLAHAMERITAVLAIHQGYRILSYRFGRHDPTPPPLS